MHTPLSALIAERKIEAFRALAVFPSRSSGVVWTIKHSDLKGAASIHIRVEYQSRIADISAWESGLCDLQTVDLAADDEVSWRHHQDLSEESFIAIVREAVEFVSPKE